MGFMLGFHGPYEAFKHCKDVCMEAGPKRVIRNAALVVSTTFTVVKVGKKLYKWYNYSYLRKQKQEACRLSKQRLQERLKEVEDSSTWDEITGMSSTDLIHKLQKKELKAIDVLRAFQYKALQADDELNCVVEPIWEAEAQALEEDLEGIKGPLHGVPVSLKDTYGVMGYDGTVGLASRINQPFLEDAVVVKVLKRSGAIPFVKTPSPPAMYSFETSSALYGRTCNPHDPSRIPGGSSGGEAALLARHGSIIGFGSDLGGSIRIPSAMCGTYGLKPTIGRISKKGMSPLCRTNQMVASSIGPMARDVEGLVSVMRALLVPYMYELDPNSVPILFQNEVYESKRPLRIGYYTYDGFVQAVPAMVRGVEMAKAALEKQGHTLVPYDPLDTSEAYNKLWVPMFAGDHGDGFKKELDGDKQDPCVAMLYYIFKTSERIRKPLCRFIGLFSPGAARLLSIGMDYETVYDWFKACRKLETYREDVAASWKEKKLDAVICPGFTMTAVPPGQTIFQQLSYTAVYNALNFPAGSVPVTKVTAEDEDKLEKEYPTVPFYHKITKEGSRGSTGLPVNVQCVALPFQDEMCLRVMKELDTALKMTN